MEETGAFWGLSGQPCVTSQRWAWCCEQRCSACAIGLQSESAIVLRLSSLGTEMLLFEDGAECLLEQNSKA